MGYIYLIKDSSNETFKIGRIKDINKRIKTLQTGNCTELELIFSFKTDYAARLESMLHRRFEHYRLYNEWFRLPEDIVRHFHFYCQELNDIIVSLKDNHYFSKNLK